MRKKTIVIVLGNRLNDDGSITDIQKHRLQMAIELNEMFQPDYFILSGGVANEKAIISEAEGMYNFLINNSFPKEKLILEKESRTTVENAKYSVPIVKELKGEVVIVCTSAYHLGDPKYKAMESFVKELENSGITLMTYCK